ncbi:MAG TPA: gliding motility protein GldM [Bacteroidia bacterium]|jgi:gliding motility-associated protein GldM|nr:gliding motility protein GldM [Bacteroidia bacterium]
MAGGKETPRQKMIGMMYLVLTALLAMNVSKDILKAFVTVNESLERTNKNFSDNTIKVMKSFEDAKASNPSAAPYYTKAVEAKKLTGDLYEHMEKLKHELIKGVFPEGGDTTRLRFVDAKDNYDIPTHHLIGDNESTPIKGEFTASDLRDRVQNVHDKLIKMVQDMQKDKKTVLLKDDYDALLKKIETFKPDALGETEDGNPISWEVLNFYHLPLAGVITNISKMQADLKNIEAEIISQLSGASGKVSIKFNQLSAKVVAPKGYIMAGEPYKADIFLAASSTDFKDENMQVLIGAQFDTITKKLINEGKAIPLAGGMGKLEESNGVGNHEFNGVIKFKKPTGEYDYYPFSGDYTVAAPSCAVSPDKMNVFYIGVDNPITVSAAGVAPGDLVVSGSGGGITIKPSGAGKYIVRGSSEAKDAKIMVSAKTKDGVKAQGPAQIFRVKRIPDPVAAIGGKKGTSEIRRVDVAGIGAVAAKLEGFDFEANFIVTSFEFTAIVKGQPVSYTGNGPSMTSDMKAALGKVATGSKIFIDNVKAKGPDGSLRNIPGVTLKVKG